MSAIHRGRGSGWEGGFVFVSVPAGSPAGIDVVDGIRIHHPVVVAQSVLHVAIESRIQPSKTVEGLAIPGVLHHDKLRTLAGEVAEGGIVAHVIVKAEAERELDRKSVV